MSRPHRPTAEFPQHLRALAEHFPLERSLGQDPLSCVLPFAKDRRSAEVAGVFASTLAVGNTTSIRRSFARLLERTHGDLRGWVEGIEAGTWRSSLGDFRHRWIRSDQLGYLAYRLRSVYEEYPTLEEVFLSGMTGGLGFEGGLAALSAALRSPGGRSEAPSGYDRLFPSPLDRSHSPCKRLTLFVRWMVRREYPDLGLWTRVPLSELRIPLDQHVYWIAYHLGLTHRRTRNWATVEEVTGALRTIEPDDPTRFDFVLCHTGISGDCPKRRDIAVCGPCLVRPDCLLWRGVRGGG